MRRRFLKMLGLLGGAAVLPSCDGPIPPPPPPTTTLPPPPPPPPTPTPPPQGEVPFWDGMRFNELILGAVSCCCTWMDPNNPDCEVVDEGIEDGWVGANPTFLGRCFEESNGKINAVYLRHAIVNPSHPTYRQHQFIVDSCLEANRLGMLAFMDMDDTWPSRHGVDKFGRALRDFRGRATREVLDDHTLLASMLKQSGAQVVFGTINEGFLAGLNVSPIMTRAFDDRRVDLSAFNIQPASQPELTDYENDVVAAIKQGYPGAVIGINSAAPNVNFHTLTFVHGDPEGRTVPDAPPGPTVIAAETNNEVYSVEKWERIINRWHGAGGSVMIWRGPNSRESMSELRRRLASSSSSSL